MAPYAFVTPAVILYVLVLLIPIGYTIYLSLEKTEVSGLGLGAGARRQVFAVRYGDPPDPPAVTMLMDVLRSVAEPAESQESSGSQGSSG